MYKRTNKTSIQYLLKSLEPVKILNFWIEIFNGNNQKHEIEGFKHFVERMHREVEVYVTEKNKWNLFFRLRSCHIVKKFQNSMKNN